MEKFMHGSKSYLEQLANKILIQVEISNRNIKSKSGKNIVVSQLIKRELNIEEKKILSKNFNMENFVDIIESSKIQIDSKVYHSKNYNRKRSSDSYTISFEQNGSTEYGEILYFFQHQDIVYARLNKFLKAKAVLKPAKLNSFFYDSFESLYNKFYSVVDIDSEKCCSDIILVNNIKYKSIRINYKNTLYHITDVVYEYEHD
jgi:hypothetical protein